MHNLKRFLGLSHEPVPLSRIAAETYNWDVTILADNMPVQPPNSDSPRPAPQQHSARAREQLAAETGDYSERKLHVRRIGVFPKSLYYKIISYLDANGMVHQVRRGSPKLDQGAQLMIS